MKPAAFDYERPETLEAAVAALSRGGKVLAGGQSLLPMLNLRLVEVDRLIDISRLSELRFIKEEPHTICIGAATTHNAIVGSPIVARYLPLMTGAYQHVAHHSIRNRGTLGGSLCHADPAAEMPLISVLLHAVLVVRNVAGVREIRASEFFQSAFETALEADEILTEIRIPKVDPACGWSFHEVNQRRGDFALVAAGGLLSLKRGACSDVRIGYRNVGEGLFRLPEVEQLLEGACPTSERIRDAAELAGKLVRPDDDLHADATYRRELVVTLTERLLAEAVVRAGGTLRS